MENNKTNEIIDNQELINTAKFPYKYTNIFSPKENNNDFFVKRMRRKTEQLSPSSSSMTTTIKYEYTISKNNPLKENQIKNEHDIYSQLNTTENILRTQSRILTNKPDDEFFLLKNGYSFRNKGFENFNMNKVCGSSHHKKKKNIINQKLQQINKKNFNNINELKENFKVIKEYKLNYNYDNNITKESDYENKDYKNNYNNNIHNTIKILKSDYYINTDNNYKHIPYDANKKINYNCLHTNEIKFLSDFIPETKTEKKFLKDTNSKSSKYISPQKEYIPNDIKCKIFNTAQKYKNDFNNFLCGGSIHHFKKNKYLNEKNKTMNKIELNKKNNFWNKYYSQDNKIRGNVTNKKERYNNLENKFKNIIFNTKKGSIKKTINLINKYGYYKKEKCVLPPNNLSNIIFKREKEFFES